ncbi:hypothetical protein HC928_01290 [bacterium]|nr:hypothetical protein [bacterium]
MRIETRDQLAGLHWKRIDAGTEIVIASEIDIRDHNGPVTIFCDGTADAPVVIRGEGQHLVKGRGLRLTGQHVLVYGLRVEGGAFGGLKVEGGISNLGPETAESFQFEGCEVTRAGYGFWLERARHIFIEKCIVQDGVMVVDDEKNPDNDYGAGFAHLSGPCADVVIRRNTAINLNAYSPDYGSDGSFVEIGKDASRISVLNNTAYNSLTLIEMGGYQGKYTAQDVRVTGNAVYAMPGEQSSSLRAITLHTPHAKSQYGLAEMRGVVIENNTFYNFTRGDFVPGRDEMGADELVIGENDRRTETLTEAAFLARHGNGAPDVPAVEPPVVEPPVVEPPDAATGTLELRIVATINGQTIQMTDAVASLIVPDAISQEERALLDQWRGLSEEKRALVGALVAAL